MHNHRQSITFLFKRIVVAGTPFIFAHLHLIYSQGKFGYENIDGMSWKYLQKPTGGGYSPKFSEGERATMGSR